MRTLRARLPRWLVSEIEAESRERRMSESEVIRERLERAPRWQRTVSYDPIADLVGKVKGLPADLSGCKRKYLRTTAYGQKRLR